ncbi:MAG: hypothetical protein MJE77_20830 [Proteobacteria bacterium]|nr:hypothetical protein [Pseudomonadota bacterium]
MAGFPSIAGLDRFWSSAEHRALFADQLDGRLKHALATDGRPAYMLVQGTVTEPGPIETHMQIIVPMIIERGGVYMIWTPREHIRVLAGHWQR